MIAMKKIYVYYHTFFFLLPRCNGSLDRQAYSTDDIAKLLPTKYSVIPLCLWKNVGKYKPQCFVICLYVLLFFFA